MVLSSAGLCDIVNHLHHFYSDASKEFSFRAMIYYCFFWLVFPPKAVFLLTVFQRALQGFYFSGGRCAGVSLPLKFLLSAKFLEFPLHSNRLLKESAFWAFYKNLHN